MYITKDFSFEAAHTLPRHPGKCSRLHGHSYGLTVGIQARINPDTGFVMDYADLKALVSPIVDKLDHKDLNTLIRYPTAEYIALAIAYLLWPSLPLDVTYFVTIRETENTSATWRSDSTYDNQFPGLSVFPDRGEEWRGPLTEDPLVWTPNSAGFTKIINEAADAFRTAEDKINDSDATGQK